jgi:8-oxo-dGTP pyrophosphatase MutT (NUDIX family)
MERHMTVSGFVVEGDRTLLHWHRKNSMWLPPGGHIERDEDPVQAVIREVAEETGITAEIVAPYAPRASARFAVPPQLPPPYVILVEDIEEGPHQHIDCVYFLRAVAGTARVLIEDDPFVWVSAAALRRDDALPVASCGVDIAVPPDVRALGLAAIELVQRA